MFVRSRADKLTGHTSAGQATQIFPQILGSSVSASGSSLRTLIVSGRNDSLSPTTWAVYVVPAEPAGAEVFAECVPSIAQARNY